MCVCVCGYVCVCVCVVCVCVCGVCMWCVCVCVYVVCVCVCGVCMWCVCVCACMWCVCVCVCVHACGVCVCVCLSKGQVIACPHQYPLPLFPPPTHTHTHAQIGWRRIRGSRHDLEQPKLVVCGNIFYPSFIFLLLAYACVSQALTCFLRDQVGGRVLLSFTVFALIVNSVNKSKLKDDQFVGILRIKG